MSLKGPIRKSGLGGHKNWVHRLGSTINATVSLLLDMLSMDLQLTAAHGDDSCAGILRKLCTTP